MTSFPESPSIFHAGGPAFQDTQSATKLKDTSRRVVTEHLRSILRHAGRATATVGDQKSGLGVLLGQHADNCSYWILTQGSVEEAWFVEVTKVRFREWREKK